MSPHLEPFADGQRHGQARAPLDGSPSLWLPEVPLEALSDERIDQHRGGVHADAEKGYQVLVPAGGQHLLRCNIQNNTTERRRDTQPAGNK